MHRRIVEAIEKALTQRGTTEKENLLRIFVQRQQTDGYWKMCIVPNKGYEHLIPHIELIGRTIGNFYGEGLSIEKAKDKSYIILS